MFNGRERTVFFSFQSSFLPIRAVSGDTIAPGRSLILRKRVRTKTAVWDGVQVPLLGAYSACYSSLLSLTHSVRELLGRIRWPQPRRTVEAMYL